MRRHFHDLPHIFASLMIAAGVSPSDREALAHTDRNGQSDAMLVGRPYGELYPGSSKQAGAALGRYLTAEEAERDARGMQTGG